MKLHNITLMDTACTCSCGWEFVSLPGPWAKYAARDHHNKNKPGAIRVVKKENNNG